MKRIYIKPETVLTSCRMCNMVMASKTEWHTGYDGEGGPGSDTPVGPEQPNPNEDAKGFSGLWDDVEDEEDW